AVPGAEVAATNQNTNITERVTTTGEGQYTVTNLDPGRYTVSVTARGFKTATVRDVTIYVNQTVRVDVKLDVGDVATSVEVTAGAPVVQSETSQIGSVVDSHQVRGMPLNGRSNIFSLLTLAPGIQATGQNPVVGGGEWFGSTNMTIDGVSNIDTGNERLSPLVPSIEGIGEFQVITNAASAEFGLGGAQVVVATKSGTNGYHGSLFAFNRNRALSAKNFFATSLPKPPFNRNEFGGSAGGPIVRDKLFFFGSFEGLRRRASATVISAMPTAALKAGNFAGLSPIRDPDTGASFPNNQIPDNRISAASKELLKFASDPNMPGTGAAGLGNNFIYNSPTRESNDRYSGRIDYQASSKDRITGRFFAANNGPFVSAVGNATDKFGNWSGFGTSTRDLMTSYTRLFSPNLINEIRFGLLHIHYFRTPQNKDVDPSKFIPGLISPVPDLGGLPTVSIVGFRGFFDQPGSGDRQRNYEIFETLSWARGRHNIKTGFGYQRVSAFNFQNPAPPRGSFTFDGRYTGHSFADFLLGDASATAHVTKNLEAEPENSRYSAYMQDDWNVAPRLTLNIGLRYELEGLFQNGRGDLANFYPDLGKIVLLSGAADPRFAGLPIVDGPSVHLGPSNYLYRDWNNFAPRLGFAYRPFGSTRFVVRSSYGIFYDVIGGYIGYTGLANNPPFRVVESFEPLSGPTPSLTFANPFPGTGTIPANPNINSVARSRVNPYHQQWNFTLEGEAARNLSLRASYVGNKGTHLPRQFNLNDPPPAPGAVQPRRPFQPFGPIGYYESGRNSISNQLQLEAIRRFAGGLALQFEYAYTNALGEQPFGISAPTDNRNTRLDRGHADFVRHHLATANYIYDLPFGKGRRFPLSGVADKILGGWQLAGITSFGTGQPLSVTFTSTTLGWPSSRADLTGDPSASNRSIDSWFNPAAFAVPAPFTYGNSARNLLFGPGFFNWDAGVFKNTRLREGLNLEFRSEFFNVLNHANFDIPASNISVPAQVGRITSTSNTARDIQFGLRLSF
ncbi:MAG: hypothetical protein DMG07_15230, partial [Acidobacteria bacterium]